MKGKLFVNVVANVLLVVVIGVVATVVFGGGIASVFNKNDNAPIYRGNGEKQISLMINVYWGDEYIEEMLAILQKYQVNCTFFVGGSWVAKNPELLLRIVQEGHEIGNHGYFHKEHGKLSYQQSLEEIKACNKIVFEYCGTMPTLFAPPGGDFCSATLQASADLGCKTIMWSRDTIDWRDKDTNLVYERATKNTLSGELILMHPTLHTKNALQKIVEYYLDGGYKLVTVSQNISSNNQSKI